MAENNTTQNNTSQPQNDVNTQNNTTTDASQKSNAEFDLKIGNKAPDFHANIANIIAQATFPNRTNQAALISPNGHNTSVRLRKRNINLSSSENSQVKITPNQTSIHSIEEKHVTNRLDMDLDEIIINEHKLNPNLWEYADFRNFTDMYGDTHCVGHFTTTGTILTPSWDHRLKKYVLIRRLCRMPLFSPSVNVPEILNVLNINDSTKVVNNYQIKQTTTTVDDWYAGVKSQDTNKYATNVNYNDINNESAYLDTSTGGYSSGGFSGGGGGTGYTPSTSGNCNIALQTMVTSDDCTYASAAMFLNAYGYNLTTEDMHAKYNGINVRYGGFAKDHGIDVEYIEDNVTKSQIDTALKEGKPVYLYYTNEKGGWGSGRVAGMNEYSGNHAVILAGYNPDGTIHVLNPANKEVDVTLDHAFSGGGNMTAIIPVNPPKTPTMKQTSSTADKAAFNKTSL